MPISAMGVSPAGVHRRAVVEPGTALDWKPRDAGSNPARSAMKREPNRKGGLPEMSLQGRASWRMEFLLKSHRSASY